MQNTKVEDDKKKRRVILLILLLLIIASLHWFFFTGTNRLDSFSVAVKQETLNVSTFDKEETRVKALLNNLIVTVDEIKVLIDPTLGHIEENELVYVDGDLTINMSNVMSEGVVIVTATYQESLATTSFNLTLVGTKRIATPTADDSGNTDTSEPSDPGIGNVIDAPAEVSPIRDINNEVAETPEEKDTNEEVSNENAVVNPIDVATPVNNPDTNQEQAPEVANISYNKVSIIFDNGESLSLFSTLGGGKLVIVYKDGTYINASSGNRIDFSVGGEDVISFSMTEYNASGSAIATSSGSYSK